MSDIATVVGPGLIATTTATHAACTVTVPLNPSGGPTWLDGVLISASAAPAALVRATISGLTNTAIGVNISANAFAPIGIGFGTRPLPTIGSPPAPLVVSVPDLGASVVCDVTVFYHYI